MIVAIQWWRMPRAHSVQSAVPKDQSLGAGPTDRGTDTDDLGNRAVGASLDHPSGLIHKLPDLERVLNLRCALLAVPVLESSRSSMSDVESDPMGHALPEWVERDFRGYLECGILAHGFARARCEDCDHERLIPFSCKGRGICPSCNGRRMCEAAAHRASRCARRAGSGRTTCLRWPG